MNRAYLIVTASPYLPKPMHALWVVVAPTAAQAKAALYRYWRGDFGWDGWRWYIADLACVRSLGLTPEVPPGMVYIEAHPDLWTRAETAYTRWSGEPVIGACGETSNGGATNGAG